MEARLELMHRGYKPLIHRLTEETATPDDGDIDEVSGYSQVTPETLSALIGVDPQEVRGIVVTERPWVSELFLFDRYKQYFPNLDLKRIVRPDQTVEIA